jgi:hypothetical protein
MRWYCDLRGGQILIGGMVGSLRLSGCRSSDASTFMDWVRGHDKMRQERRLGSQMTQARQRCWLQGRHNGHQALFRAEIANRHLSYFYAGMLPLGL